MTVYMNDVLTWLRNKMINVSFIKWLRIMLDKLYFCLVIVINITLTAGTLCWIESRVVSDTNCSSM